MSGSVRQRSRVQGGRAVAFGTNTGARWVEAGEQRFYARSRWEGNFGLYLEWLRTRGLIMGWAHEPITFWFDGIRRGVCSYKPDFRTDEVTGAAIYWEVKGYMSPQNRTALRRMTKYHPNVTLRLIDAAQYSSIAAQVAGLVPGWA